MECTPGEDAVKIVEVTAKALEYNKDLFDKAVAVSERTDSNFESSTVPKMLSNSTACYRETIHKRKSTDEANFTTVLFEKIAMATPIFSNHHPDQPSAINIKARPTTSKKTTSCWRLRLWLAVFSNKVVLI